MVGSARFERATCPDCFGQLFFAHQRNRVYRDPFSAQIVAISLGRSSNGYLADLGAAADDDEPLAENSLESLFLFHLFHRRQGSEFGDKGLGVLYAGNLKEDRFHRFPAIEYGHPDNVAAQARDHSGELMQRPPLVLDLNGQRQGIPTSL